MNEPPLPAAIKPNMEAIRDLRDRLGLGINEAKKLATYHAMKDAIRDAKTVEDLRRVLWTLVEHV